MEEVVAFLADVRDVQLDGLGGPREDLLEAELRGQLEQRERLEEQRCGHGDII